MFHWGEIGDRKPYRKRIQSKCKITWKREIVGITECLFDACSMESTMKDMKGIEDVGFSLQIFIVIWRGQIKRGERLETTW